MPSAKKVFVIRRPYAYWFSETTKSIQTFYIEKYYMAPSNVQVPQLRRSERLRQKAMIAKAKSQL